MKNLMVKWIGGAMGLIGTYFIMKCLIGLSNVWFPRWAAYVAAGLIYSGIQCLCRWLQMRRHSKKAAPCIQ